MRNLMLMVVLLCSFVGCSSTARSIVRTPFSAAAGFIDGIGYALTHHVPEAVSGTYGEEEALDQEAEQKKKAKEAEEKAKQAKTNQTK